jgi:AcrR family transcriptional regulator
MSGKRSLTDAAVFCAAADLVEEQGYEKLSMSTLAHALGVKTPSLYNHTKGIDDVWQQLAQVTLERMEVAVRDAAIGRSEEDALREIAFAYRRFAKEHAELYRVFTNAPFAKDGSLDALANTLRKVLQPFGLEQTTEIDFIRIFHAGLHGFVTLEGAGFFKNAGATADHSFAALVDSQILIAQTYRKKV